MSYPFREVF